jgi:hypothetical protein
MSEYITFKHYRTGEVVTKKFRHVPEYNPNESSDLLVIWDEDENRLEDVRKKDIIEYKSTRD